MIATKHRFNRRNHVNYVHRKGKTVRGKSMALRYIRGQKHQHFRVAVIVSRKVDKRAVLRNRIRRRVYEIIRQLEPPIQPDVDLIISLFDSSAADMPAKQLQQQLQTMLEQAGLQQPPPDH